MSAIIFCIITICKKLKQAKHSLVDIIKVDRCNLAKILIEPKQECVNSRKFFWHKKSRATFLQRQPKDKKMVGFSSIMHFTPDVDTTTAANNYV